MAILINDVEPRVQYTAIAAQTVFTVPFEFFDDADLVVLEDGVTQTGGGLDYSVTGAGVTGGGTITFTVAMTGGEIITIYRDVPVSRLTDYQNNGDIRATSLNTDLDRIVAMVQQQETEIGRSLRLSRDDMAADLTLPSESDRALKFLSFDVDGEPQASAGTATVDINTAAFLQSGTGAVTRTVESKLKDIVSVKDFGAVGDGSTDDTAAIQAALDAHLRVYAPAGNYRHTGLTLRAGNVLMGDGWNATTLTLANGSDTHSILIEDVDDTLIRDLRIEGNKANQTAGTSGRGIYYLANLSTCQRHALDHVWVNNAADHGVFNSGTDAGAGSAFYHCRSTNNGDGTGPGGSGFLMGRGGLMVGCYAGDNLLTGFKSASGIHINCVSENNQAGFTNGSVAYSTGNDYVTWQNCRVKNCGGGFSNQGQAKWVFLDNCVAEEIDTSGIEIVNDSENIIIKGFIARNCGKNFVRSQVVGGDGISIIASTGAPMNVLIDNFLIDDDQGSPTTDYGIYIDVEPVTVNIGAGIITNMATAPIFVNKNNPNDIRVSDQVLGLETNQLSRTDASVTGTTAKTLLNGITIPINSHIHLGATLVVRGGGFVSGTAGTKTLTLDVGTSTNAVMNQAAGDTNSFGFEFKIFWETPTVAHILGPCSESDATTVHLSKKVTADMGTAIPVEIYGTLGNAADTITLDWFEVTQTR